ncbi:MAG: hypothetical protein EAZ43_08595 [Betaproteobacteria bacterium]|nr:MAG: hypothetical protein EAZ43_08595 [Betaproteobacteria bacterium]
MVSVVCLVRPPASANGALFFDADWRGFEADGRRFTPQSYSTLLTIVCGTTVTRLEKSASIFSNPRESASKRTSRAQRFDFEIFGLIADFFAASSCKLEKKKAR